MRRATVVLEIMMCIQPLERAAIKGVNYRRWLKFGLPSFLAASRRLKPNGTMITMKTMMAVAALALVTGNVQAELGDTYATSVRRYGSRGEILNRGIFWRSHMASKANIYEEFHHNQCVAIIYACSPGKVVAAESEIWRMLMLNSRSDQHWAEYQPGQYVTNDGTIYGFLYRDGSGLRIAYKSWLDRHSKFEQPERQPATSERAPVEDEI
jgi:hypothetical protein